MTSEKHSNKSTDLLWSKQYYNCRRAATGLFNKINQ